MSVRKQSKIASNKRSKIKISWGSILPDLPCLPHALHTDTYLPPLPPSNPSPIIYIISFCPPLPFGKKLKETLIMFACFMPNFFPPDFGMHLVMTLLIILLPISSSGSCTPSPSPCTVCNKLLCVVTMVPETQWK